MREAWRGAGEEAPRRRRSAAALGLIATLAIAVAGCGGGGDSGGESESAARKKLETGAQMISGAESLRLSLLLETEEDGESETVGCINLAADTAKPESFDLIFFEGSCEGGIGGNEMVAIGHRAWGSTGPGSWREAKITPQVLHEISTEQTDFGTLMQAAEDIEATPEGGAVEAANGRFVDATSYSFEAPASAFPSSADLGDLKVEFEATVDNHGYMRELVVHGDEDGAGATLTATYEDIDEPQEIEPPKKSEVHGGASLIRSRDELDALFGLSTP